MSFQFKGIEVEKLQTLWSDISPKLPAIISANLKECLELILLNDTGAFSKFIKICCEHKPANYTEYIAYVMITTATELLNCTSTFFRLQKLQLLVHTFSTNVEFWSHDPAKVNKNNQNLVWNS